VPRPSCSGQAPWRFDRAFPRRARFGRLRKKIRFCLRVLLLAMPQAPLNQACKQGKEEPRAGPHGMNPCMIRQGFKRIGQGIPVTERSAKRLILSCSLLICSPRGAPASLTLLHPRCYDFPAGWSSLVARWAHNPKVGGSNPPPATKPNLHKNNHLDLIARVPNTACRVPFNSH
jgi:hypothetical protein